MSERDDYKPDQETNLEVPTPILEAVKKHQQYVEGGKSDRVLLAQAVSDLIGYIPAGESMTPLSRVSSMHKRQLLLNVEKDRGGDRTAMSLGVFALQLEADKYPSAKADILALLNDAVDVANEGWSN